ncbi:MAG: hypothetical protein M1825_000099 [Sarcosagium campestre]|nr:MAG: hypothetical protein M1825_000099 [Sarcosagium campestre]
MAPSQIPWQMIPRSRRYPPSTAATTITTTATTTTGGHFSHPVWSKSLQYQQSRLLSQTATHQATALRRPKRPYTFTQLIRLSDGSTAVHRTTSPAPVLRTVKDSRNHPLWNPSSQKLVNAEEDEAGRLRAFRMRFGRGWDAESSADASADGEEDGDGLEGAAARSSRQTGDAAATADHGQDSVGDGGLMDLISGYDSAAKEDEKKTKTVKTDAAAAVAAQGGKDGEQGEKRKEPAAKAGKRR